MIFLTRINNERFVLNSDFILEIESIPESKITMTNKDVFIAKESPREIIEKTIEFRKMFSGQIKVVEKRQDID